MPHSDQAAISAQIEIMIFESFGRFTIQPVKTIVFSQFFDFRRTMAKHYSQ